MKSTLSLLLLAALALPVSAATRTWDGESTSNSDWSTSANWNPNGVPVAGDSLVFPAGIGLADRATNNNFTSGTAFAGLLFQAEDYSVSGNSFDLTSGGIFLAYGNGTTTISPTTTIRLSGTAQSFDTGIDKPSLVTAAVNLNGQNLELKGSGGSITIGGNIVNSVGTPTLTKSGAVDAILDGFNNFSGVVELTAGRLFANDLIAGTGNLNVRESGVLCGNGAIVKTTLIQGRLRPGTLTDSTTAIDFETLNFSTSTTLPKTLELDIDGNLAGDTHDRVDIGTSVTLNSAPLVLDFGSYNPPAGTSFTLLNLATSATRTGNFNGISEGTILVLDGQRLQFTYAGGTGNDFVATVVNQRPIATNLSAAETYTEDTSRNLTNIVVTDPDSNVTATLTLSSPSAGSLSTATSGSVTSSYAAGTGVWTASGPVSNVNTLLAGVTFNPATNFNSNFTIDTQISDGLTGPITGSKTMTGTAVNDAPTVIAPANFTVTEDLPGNLTFTGTPFGDVDHASLTVLLVIGDGTISASSAGGVTVGGTAMARTFSGTTASLNSYFTTAGNITCTTALNNTNPRTLTTQVSDGSLSASVNSTIHITAVNDPPSFTVGPDQVLPISPGAQTIPGWATGMSGGPANESGQTFAFVVTSNNNPGLFSVSPAVSPTGTLSYTPTPGLSGTAVIGLMLQDDGGTANGGSNASTSQTFTITITPHPDTPPVFDTGVSGTATVAGNFDALPTTDVPWVDDATVPGWYAQINNGSTSAGVFQSASDSATFGLVSSGTAGSPDRALGSRVTSSTGLANISYALVMQNTGSQPARLTRLSYALELWHSGNAADAPEHATVFYAITDAPLPSISSGPSASVATAGPRFAAMPAAANSQISSATTSSVLDGNLPGNRTAVSFQPAAQDLPGILPGQYLTVKWTDSNQNHTDGEQAIDNVLLDFASASNAPSIDAIPDPPSIPEDSGLQTLILSGLGSATQPLSLTATSDNPALIQNPSIAYTSPGTTASLTYTPEANANGKALITVTASNGVATVVRSFTVTVTPINDAPTFTSGQDLDLIAEARSFLFPGWATNISRGPVDENSQTLSFAIVSNSNPTLFSMPPAVSTSGDLTFYPAPGMEGTAVIQIQAHDSGGSDNGGSDTSAAQSFSITFRPPPSTSFLPIHVDDAPGGSVTVSESFDGAVQLPTPSWVDNFTAPGWYAQINNGTTPAGLFQPGDGTTLLSGLINCGSASTSDRALGSRATVTGGFANISYALMMRNTGSLPVRLARLHYAQELWRSGGSLPNAEKVTVFYSVSNEPLASIASGGNSGMAQAGAGFSPLPAAANTQISSPITSTALDGNLPANRSTVDFLPAPSDLPSILPGQYLTIKWTDSNEPQLDGHQAIDDVILEFAPVLALDPVANPAPIAEDAGTQTVNLTGIRADAPPAVITATSSNPALIPDPAINHTSPNSTGSLTYTPAPNAHGTAVITVTLSDGLNPPTTLARSFTVTVTPVNDPPGFTRRPVTGVYAANTPTLLPVIAVANVDDAPAVTITLSNPAAGSLATATSGSVTSNYHAVTGTWTASGPVANLNDLLDGLLFTPAPGFTADFRLLVEIDDGEAAPVSLESRVLGPASAVLYQQDFTADDTANWTVNDSGLSDITVEFFHDYSGIGVPAAPGGSGTRGLKMSANNTGGVFSGFSVSPTGQNFSGNYLLAFDLWSNYAGPLGQGSTGTTQVSTYGVGTSGILPVWPGGFPKESAMFGNTLDGGSGFDFRAYSSAAPSGYPAGNPVYFAPDRETNNSASHYSHFSPTSAPLPQLALFPDQTGSTDVGETAFRWIRAEILVRDGFATWSLDGLPIAKINLSTVTLGGGNIFFGHSDSNATSSSDPNDVLLNATLIDNIKVYQVPLTPLQTWRQLHFATISNAGNAADNFDFDKDGIVNLIEFAFGLNPTISDAHLMPQAQRVGNELVFSFTPPPGVSGITYGAESSETMAPGDWHPVPNTGTAPGHEFKILLGIKKKDFVRLIITGQAEERAD